MLIKRAGSFGRCPSNQTVNRLPVSNQSDDTREKKEGRAAGASHTIGLAGAEPVQSKHVDQSEFQDWFEEECNGQEATKPLSKVGEQQREALSAVSFRSASASSPARPESFQMTSSDF